MITASISINDQELKALERRLFALGAAVSEKHAKSAAGFAMTPILKTAKQKTPKRLGTLERSLGKKTKNYKASGVAVCLVGPRSGFKDDQGNDPRFYAHLVEYGTGAHLIAAEPRLTIGDDVIGGEVNHPGAKAQPFMRPAYDEQKDTAVSRYRANLLKRIEKEVKKLGKGAVS